MACRKKLVLPAVSERSACLPGLRKHSSFFFSEIMIISSRPALTRGAFRDRHERGAGDAVDVRGSQRVRCMPTNGPVADGEAVWSWHPDAGVKFATMRSASRRRRWPKSPVHRGERGVAVKTIAQGRPDVRLVPVVTAACIFCCRRAMGAACTRPSLRPLPIQRADRPQSSGATAPRGGGPVSSTRF